MNISKKQLVIIVAVVLIGSVVALTIYGLNRRPASQSNSGITNTNQRPTAKSDDVDGTYLKNIELLEKDYTAIEYMFINQNVLDFSNQNFGTSRGLQIDTTSYTKRSESSRGFGVLDQKGQSIFYVVVTRNPDTGQLRIEEFL